MAWFDTKQAAVDPDNPAANEQIPFSEWNGMVLYLKDKIVDKTVNTAAIGNDKILVYKTATSTFVFEAPSTIATLDDMTDVVISGVPADNEVLGYDIGTSKWINQTAAEAGLATTTDLAAYLALAGGSMSGDLHLGDNTIAGLDALKAYNSGGVALLDNSGNTKATFGGSHAFSVHGDMSMVTNQIKYVGDPTAAQDASTKNYDDTHLFTKEAVTSFTDGYVPVYRTASGKFEMESQGAAGAVMEADFNATTFLYATADNTPLPKTPAEVMAILSGTAATEFLFNTKQIGGIVDPTTAQQGATKNYADLHLFTKEAVTTFTDGYIPVYRTASGKFEMEDGGGSAGLPIVDTTAIVKGSVDGTKLVRFEVDGLTTGVTRVMTIPDKNMTIADKAEVMLLTGSQEMVGNIDMDGYYVDGYGVRGSDAAGVMMLMATEGPSNASMIILYGKDHATTPGNLYFSALNAAKTGTNVAFMVAGATDTPQLGVMFGLDMNDKVIADMKNSAPTALSGTQKDIEIDIGGTPYYFTVYPTKA